LCGGLFFHPKASHFILKKRLKGQNGGRNSIIK
jgi:hypothetical protein